MPPAEGGGEGGREGEVVIGWKRKGKKRGKNKRTCACEALREVSEGVDVQAVPSLCVSW